MLTFSKDRRPPPTCLAMVQCGGVQCKFSLTSVLSLHRCAGVICCSWKHVDNFVDWNHITAVIVQSNNQKRMNVVWSAHACQQVLLREVLCLRAELKPLYRWRHFKNSPFACWMLEISRWMNRQEKKRWQVKVFTWISVLQLRNLNSSQPHNQDPGLG